MLLPLSLILEMKWVAFVMGVLGSLHKECHSAMLHDNINISRLMVHGRRVEEARKNRKNIDAKWERCFEESSSRTRLEIQDKPWLKKRVSSHVRTNLPKSSRDSVSTPNLKREGVLIH